MKTRFPFIGSDKIIYAMDGVSPYILHLVMEIEGSLHLEHLADAIGFALERSPILKSVARLTPIAPHWEVVESVKLPLLLTVKDLSHEPTAEKLARGLVDRYINEPLDITRTPPARFLLIRFAEAHWIFIVKVHHCAVDPAAIFLMVRDIQEAYRCLLKGETPPQMEAMADRSRRMLLRRVSPLLWIRVMVGAILGVARKAASGPRSFVQFSNPRPVAAISHRSLIFSGVEYAALRTRCKSFGVTANELVMAALCRAIKDWNGPREQDEGAYSIVMPVDLRRYVRQDGRVPRIMASYIGGSWVTVPVARVTTFEATLDYVTKAVRRIKKYHLGLLANLAFPLLVFIPPRWLRQVARSYVERHPGRSVPTSVFAYLGKLDRALSIFPGCQITRIEGIGTGFFPVGFDVVVLAHRRAYTVTITYSRLGCMEEEIDQFVALFSHEILPQSSSRPKIRDDSRETG